MSLRSYRLAFLLTALAALVSTISCGDMSAEIELGPTFVDAGDDGQADTGDERHFDIGPDSALDVVWDDTAALDVVEGDPGPPSNDTATLRVIHAAPTTQALAAHLDDDALPLFNGLEFGAATERAIIAPGNHVLSICRAESHNQDPPVAVSEEMTVPAGASITAIIAQSSDTDSNDGTGENLEILLLSESFRVPALNRAVVRFVHAAADAPPVRLDLDADGLPELGSVEPFSSSAVEGVSVRANKSARVALWVGDEYPEVLTTFTLSPFDEGDTALLVLTGRQSRLPRERDGLSLLVIEGEGRYEPVRQDPTLYVMHAAPDAPALDLFLAEQELADGLMFGDLSDPVRVSPGTYLLDLYAHYKDLSSSSPPNELDVPAARGETGSLDAGDSYLLVATGLVGSSAEEARFQFLTVREGFDLSDSAARLRLVNASPLSPSLGAALLTESGLIPLTEGLLAFGEATAETGIPLPAETLMLALTLDLDILLAIEIALNPAERLILVATGLLPDVTTFGSPELFDLVLIRTDRQPWSVRRLGGL